MSKQSKLRDELIKPDIQRLMYRAGAPLSDAHVSSIMIEYINHTIDSLTPKCVKLMQYSDRKTLKSRDVRAAIKQSKGITLYSTPGNQ